MSASFLKHSVAASAL